MISEIRPAAVDSEYYGMKEFTSASMPLKSTTGSKQPG